MPWSVVMKYAIAVCFGLFGSMAMADDVAPAAPSLKVGSEVSLEPFSSVTWVQGEGPKSFEAGKVYIFECWATWCGPCVAAIPHVNELHETYAEKGLRVYGMNVWEDGIDKVKTFVKAKGKGMSYPVAYTGRGSAFEKQWLTAAGVRGIPHAFVVIDGKVALMAHPSMLTNANIELLLSGPEGVEKVAKQVVQVTENRDKMGVIMRSFRTARQKKDVEGMKQQIDAMNALDPKSPYREMLLFELLETQQDWSAALKCLEEMTEANRSNLVNMGVMRLVQDTAVEYPADYLKAMSGYYEVIIARQKPASSMSHVFAAMLCGRVDDIAAAQKHAKTAVELAQKQQPEQGLPRIPLLPFEEFAKATDAGKVPTMLEFSGWMSEARKQAVPAKKAE